jgi:hypothetical protein
MQKTTWVVRVATANEVTSRKINERTFNTRKTQGKERFTSPFIFNRSNFSENILGERSIFETCMSAATQVSRSTANEITQRKQPIVSLHLFLRQYVDAKSLLAIRNQFFPSELDRF